MRPGFEVTLTATEKAKFNCFLPQFPKQMLVTLSEDSATGIAAVLMGKIYYQDNLKTHFPQAFQQDLISDVALVLAIFREYGTAGLAQLEGEFALVIFDPNTYCLLALRDPLGNYPLYWLQTKNTIRVSTNLKLLARQSQAAINGDFLASFLMFPFAFAELASEQTAFRGIQRVLPGTLVALTPKVRATQIWSWDWQANIQPQENITPAEAGEQFTHIFRQAIRERIQFGKIASHLSGGMDSSSIVCIARELLAPQKLVTLSLVYQMRSLVGETPYIEMVLEQGGSVEAYFVDGDAALDFGWFEGNVPEHDEPYPGLFHLKMEKVLVDRAAELGVGTILSGGGSELITEGNRYHLADLILQGQWHEALREAKQWAKAKNQSLWSILSKFGLEPSLPPLLRLGIPTWLRRGYGRWPKLGDFVIPPWIEPDFAKKWGLRDKAIATLRQLHRYPIEQSFNYLELQAAAGNWASWYLAAPSDIRISQPFLDPRLITYCLSLPRQLREVPGVPKPLLQEAMGGILPEPIRTRKYKGNFNQVYWQGLSQNLPHLEAMVRHSPIGELGLFNKDKLIEVMRQHAIGIGEVKSGSHISSSLASMAWFDQIAKLNLSLLPT
jgi:asparagine synthase (glutamine-hydrolysing)